MFCKDKFSDLVGDKILEVRHYNQEQARKLAMCIYHLDEVNEETLEPIINIIEQYPNCIYSKLVINYLKTFNLLKNHSRK